MSRVIFAGYATTLGTFVVFTVLSMFIDLAFPLFLLFLLVLPALFLATLAATLIKPNRRKALRFAVILVASAVVMFSFRYQQALSNLLFWNFHQTELETLVAFVQERPRIVQSGPGRLNDVLVTTDPSQVSADGFKKVQLLDSILVRDEIEIEEYDSIRESLEEIGLNEFRRAGDWHRLRGGWNVGYALRVHLGAASDRVHRDQEASGNRGKDRRFEASQRILVLLQHGYVRITRSA